MAKTITVNFTQCRADDCRARILSTDLNGWRDAAARAIKRRLGRHADPHRWNQRNWQQDDNGRVTREYMEATIVGRGGAILGVAEVVIDHRQEV